LRKYLDVIIGHLYNYYIFGNVLKCVMCRACVRACVCVRV